MTRDALPLRPLGSTGLTVSRIGLGLAALGRPAYINLGRSQDFSADRTVADFERRCHEMLDSAYAAGIRYVDAARSYGMAEAFLGSWLAQRQLPQGAMTVGSKWGYSYVGSWRMEAPVHEIKNLSAETLRRQIAESRTFLGDRLQLYQIHSATLESGVLEDSAVLEELSQLRSEGLTIGLSVTGPTQRDVIRRALKIEVSGANPFQAVQATWNLLEPSAAEALADAKACGWGVIVKEALANGRLTDRNAAGRVAALKQQANALGVTTDAVALAAALSQPWADVVLSGAVTSGQLESNLNAQRLGEWAGGWPAIAEPPTEYWSGRSKLGWN